MQPFKRQFLGAALAAATLVGLSAPAQAQNYPERDVTAVIQWGAGGGTDVAMRGYAPYAEEALGRKIVLQNKPGASGAIGANFVLQQPADGYTILMGAEPQSLFRVMGVADFDYDKFTPINIAAVANTILLVARPDAPWANTQDLLSFVQANPKKAKQYLAGQGTVPFTINAMMSTLTKFETIQVPFDGDGPAIAALQGGHVDFGFIASGSAIEHVKAGRLKALGVLSDKPFQGIAPMTDAPSLRGITKYLPWGSWYGVFVRKETPEPVKAKLIAAFKKAGENPQYRSMMEGRGTTMLNISGAEAEAFIKKFQSTTAWLYQGAGAAKKDPATLGIAKP
ncbi:tripartite tricarboxylate transporter substrate binding protein [Hydrogenophaga sp. NFH-34]|uniref:tripartite tricarboxylate transporter substrate binding protein n=1 Tax=Hydrogenophaga sp. NFH-34 TaxID=2744446 RepID=UPI001F2092DC|nr:tripartite tricarboxylate transporter substrate binding protein [Hydrogenophaga sp. NFH-34]